MRPGWRRTAWPPSVSAGLKGWRIAVPCIPQRYWLLATPNLRSNGLWDFGLRSPKRFNSRSPSDECGPGCRVSACCAIACDRPYGARLLRRRSRSQPRLARRGLLREYAALSVCHEYAGGSVAATWVQWCPVVRTSGMCHSRPNRVLTRWSADLSIADRRQKLWMRRSRPTPSRSHDPSAAPHGSSR